MGGFSEQLARPLAEVPEDAVVVQVGDLVDRGPDAHGKNHQRLAAVRAAHTYRAGPSPDAPAKFHCSGRVPPHTAQVKSPSRTMLRSPQCSHRRNVIRSV